MTSIPPAPPTRLNIVVFGESGVGKTCFTDMFTFGEQFVGYDPTTERHRRDLDVDGRLVSLLLDDISSTSQREAALQEHFRLIIRDADGIVLLYDITNEESFEYITNQAYAYVCLCRRYLCKRWDEGGDEGRPHGERSKELGYALVGNKKDLVHNGKGKRAIATSMAKEWARSQGCEHCEVSSNDRSEVEEAMRMLVKCALLAKKQNDHAAYLAVEPHRRRLAEEERKKNAKLWAQQHPKPTFKTRLKDIFRTPKPEPTPTVHTMTHSQQPVLPELQHGPLQLSAVELPHIS